MSNTEIFMKYLPLTLFVLGLLIEVTAFFIVNADDVPLVYKIISPSFYRANNGLNMLRETKKLEQKDQGFPEIAQLFKNVAVKTNSPDVVDKIDVTQFIRKGAMLAFSSDRAKEVIKVEVIFSNGQSVNWDLNEIDSMVKDMKTSNVFRWALIMFFIGVLIQIIGFWIFTKS